MSPGPNTSKPHPQHKVYPYLLRGVEIARPNQVWSTDITYVRLPRGFVYLVAVIDGYSRKALSWRLSNPMDAGFCADCLEEAITQYGTPAIFNSDQGVQFTSAAITCVLRGNGITISMDRYLLLGNSSCVALPPASMQSCNICISHIHVGHGRGRALDNIFVGRLWRTVKYEEVYLKQHGNLPDLLIVRQKRELFQ